MLLGIRLIAEPMDNLKFELVKTSQWGGAGYNTNLSQFKAAIVGNSNENKYANINQLAGVGFSFKKDLKQISYKLYGQLIGEDESGNLPSCLMHLYGTELKLKNIRYPVTIGFEVVDTRIDFSTTGYCGPNTAYNNSNYKYINYGTSLAASVDTEGKTISIWGVAQLSKNTDVNYSIQKALINSENWSEHRLTSSAKKGWLTSIGTSWTFNSLKIKNSINYQNFKLDKKNIKNGISISLETEYVF